MFLLKVRAKCFHTLDAFVRLIALLVKHSGDQQNTITKVNLLNKVMSLTMFISVIGYHEETNFVLSTVTRCWVLWLGSSSLIMMSEAQSSSRLISENEPFLAHVHRIIWAEII